MKEISEKISSLCRKYDNFTTAIRDIEELNRIFCKEIQILLSTRVTDSDRNDVLSCSNYYRTNVQEMVKHWSESNLEKESTKRRENCIKCGTSFLISVNSRIGTKLRMKTLQTHMKIGKTN